MASPTNDTEVDKDSDEINSGNQMKAWEQHAAVINMPRFDYAAPNSLLRHSRSAFLVTCPIKREKSATKEVISYLNQYFSSSIIASTPRDENDSKRRKTLAHETNDNASSPLSLVKLTKNGLLLLLLPEACTLDSINIVVDILHRIETNSLSRPSWCHRILPVQATCILKEEELRTTVCKQVSLFLEKQKEESVKFAIGYNRRGLEDERNNEKKEALGLLDRTKCFNVVASAVKEAALNSCVDLKCPDVAILIELLPIGGIPLDDLVCAVSVLPRSLVDVKPRLSIKPLLIEGNTKKSGKQ